MLVPVYVQNVSDLVNEVTPRVVGNSLLFNPVMPMLCSLWHTVFGALQSSVVFVVSLVVESSHYLDFICPVFFILSVSWLVSFHSFSPLSLLVFILISLLFSVFIFTIFFTFLQLLLKYSYEYTIVYICILWTNCKP